MVVNQNAIDSLNYKLDDLAVEGTFRFEVKDFGSGASTFPTAMASTCCALLNKLRFYDESVTDLSQNDSEPTFSDIQQAVKSRIGGPIPSENASYSVLNFMATNLQAERLLAHAKAGSIRRDEAASTSPFLFQLDKICKDIQVVPSSPDIFAVLSSIHAKIQILASDVGDGYLKSPPPILENLILCQEQITVLESLNEALYQDFLLRRRMLMKRLDVTIESFLWGEKAQGKEGEIVAAIKAQRDNLSEVPTKYSVLGDSVSAPISLLQEMSKKVTDTCGQKSIIKSVIIGAVPDRGGRAGEMRPKARDIKPTWTRGGGRGGGGVGGGGRGGGGRVGGGRGGGGGSCGKGNRGIKHGGQKKGKDKQNG
jgi:uncharacterized membrane protein YgcG